MQLGSKMIKKAPGYDGITAEHVKFASDVRIHASQENFD